MLNRLFNIRAGIQLAVVAVFSLVLLPVSVAHAEAQAPANSIWLPLVQNGHNNDDGGNDDGGNDDGDNDGEEPAPPPAAKPWTISAHIDWQTASANIVRDSQGGLHFGYLFYEAGDGQYTGENPPTYGVYVTCAADCDQDANWEGVSFGEVVNEIQVALTPNNQPRALYRTPATDGTIGHDYFYAECNQTCTDPANWAIVQVATARGTSIINLNDDDLPQRYFALDPEGRPRFVYDDRDSFREPDHLGSFYAYCDGNCTDAANWFETRINKDTGDEWVYRSEKFYYPSLAFDAAGRPHIAADGTSMQDESALYYITCAGGCEATENWQSTPLYPRGQGVKVSYDIEINSQGAPRIAYYDGAQLEGKGDQLYYLWCNSGCTNGANWRRTSLAISQLEGQSPDLELDQNDRPHIAYILYSVGGLGYGWCEANCDSSNGTWQHVVVESGGDLAATWPVAFPQHCDGGVWNGLAPTLALDPNGSAIFGYDITFHARCWYNVDTGEWKPWTYFHLIWRAARIVYMPQE